MDSQNEHWTYRRVVIVFTSAVGLAMVAGVVTGLLLLNEPSIAVPILAAVVAVLVASVVWLAAVRRRYK